MFAHLPAAEPDKILRVMAEFAADPRDGKIDLGVGVYKAEDGTTPVLKAVHDAEARILERQTTKGYTALSGDPGFRNAVAELVLGDVPQDRLATLATPGGTGAIRQAFELARKAKSDLTVWVSDPTWTNHEAILDAMGIRWRRYRYYDQATGRADVSAMLEDLGDAARDDLVLLHGCCHNPTGADLTEADWRAIGDLLERSGAVPLVDLAYLGFADGIEADLAGLRHLAHRLPEFLLAFSGSKSFGLYRDRVGCVLALGADREAAQAMSGTLASINRHSYAFPPDHGARIVATILGDPGLRASWTEELSSMRTRINSLRRSFAEALTEATGNPGWQVLAEQRGMFSLLGLGDDAVRQMREAHAVYVVGGGRINIAGLTPASIPGAARAIADVL
ncbi:amino acid aminotransferase [Tropicimonas sp. IMCC34011]|uniref:amino acid aminotransferase n=1 Tax=Tropicimonas sp. IMCC34011 TaxID=2248759 RepID=UPI000E274C41|nr:amino acid aminotransferase [Tropicimonas sp. IMCC34011]